MREMVTQISKDLNISRNEAELVLATLLEKPRFQLYFEESLDSISRMLLSMKLIQLKKGVPIEYITKTVKFMNYSLRVYPGVFIPRLETEYFVELIDRSLKQTPACSLDIGVGTGALSIAIAHLYPESTIIGIDISPSAHACAKENILKYQLQSRISLARSDMFTAVSGQFDLIISNPPYIPRARLPHLPESVKKYEPLIALNGGEQGTEFSKRFICESKKFLNPGGMCALEIDEESVADLSEFLHSNCNAPFIFKKDLNGKYRYLFIGDFKK